MYAIFFTVIRFKVSMADIIHSQYTDQVSFVCFSSVLPSGGNGLWLSKCSPVFQWYTLNDVKSGRVHLILEWVPTVSQTDTLNQVSAATFIIYLPLLSVSNVLSCFACSFLLCYSIFDHCPYLVLSHSHIIFFMLSSSAGTAATVCPVLSEQGHPLCSPAICSYGQSTLFARKILLILYTDTH